MCTLKNELDEAAEIATENKPIEKLSHQLKEHDSRNLRWHDSDKPLPATHNIRKNKNKNKQPCYLHSIGRCRTTPELECKNGIHSDEPFDVNKWYKSGGILAYSHDNDDVQFLIGKEAVEDKWTTFGGKRESYDSDAIDTCVREFCEESIAAYVPDDVETTNLTPKQQLNTSIQYIKKIVDEQINDAPDRCLYIPGAKYRLLIIELPYISIETFNQMREKNWNSKDIIPGTEKIEFDWISAKGFMSHFRKHKLTKEWNGKTFSTFCIQTIMNANKFFKYVK